MFSQLGRLYPCVPNGFIAGLDLGCGRKSELENRIKVFVLSNWVNEVPFTEMINMVKVPLWERSIWMVLVDMSSLR